MRGRLSWVAVAAIVAAVGSASAGAETQPYHGIRPRIVNGLSTFDFPTTAALLSPADPATGSVGCSGVLIGCETILTAGHCVCAFDGPTCESSPPDPSSMLVFFQHAGFFAVSSISFRSDLSFPVGDVAVLKLATPVTGISPTPIDTTGAALGTAGTIVGFGRSGGALSDYGLKRYGSIETSTCAEEVPPVTSVCWNFTEPLGAPGENSNTCNADSGGPLFIDYGSGPVVAGVTSGGFTQNCMPDDNAFDANVAYYSAWIQQQGGADLLNTTCGSGGQVGDGETTVVGFEGHVDVATPDQIHSFNVVPGKGLLRVSMNARDTASRNFDLYVKAGSPPTTISYDCAATGAGQFGFCELVEPATGPWYILIHRVAGSGEYQATATIFGPDCTNPIEEGVACDDGSVCTVNDVCQAGTCAGTALPDGSDCSDGNPCTRPDTCQAGLCINEATPADCRGALKSQLLMKDKGGDRDKLIWKWGKGESTSQAEFGDPTDTTSYALCVYAGTTASLVAAAGIPPHPTKWQPVGNLGYQYKDKSGIASGVERVILKGSDNDRSKITVKGKGSNLPLPSLPLTFPVVVQLMDAGSATCWESVFAPGDTLVNDGETFKVKATQ